MSILRQLITKILICVLLPEVLFAGCTLVGAAIGSTYYDNNPTDISLLKSGAVKPGKYLVVSKKDSTIKKGELLIVLAAGGTSFAERYLEAARELKYTGVLPLPDDNLVFTYSIKGHRLIGRGRFRGLEPGFLLLKRSGLSADTLITIPIDSLGSLHVEEKGEVNLASIQTLILWVSTVPAQLVLRWMPTRFISYWERLVLSKWKVRISRG